MTNKIDCYTNGKEKLTVCQRCFHFIFQNGTFKFCGGSLFFIGSFFKSNSSKQASHSSHVSICLSNSSCSSCVSVPFSYFSHSFKCCTTHPYHSFMLFVSFRPRCNSIFTFASERPVISAISLYENP